SVPAPEGFLSLFNPGSIPSATDLPRVVDPNSGSSYDGPVTPCLTTLRQDAPTPSTPQSPSGDELQRCLALSPYKPAPVPAAPAPPAPVATPEPAPVPATPPRQ
ncbi:hypothetical protein GNI_177980, partial [Gregarina niphandrodes]